MITKKRKLANAKVDSNKAYSLKEASSLVKEINTTKFVWLLLSHTFFVSST